MIKYENLLLVLTQVNPRIAIGTVMLGLQPNGLQPIWVATIPLFNSVK